MGRDSLFGTAITLRAGRSGDRNPVEVRFSAPAQIYPAAPSPTRSRGEVTGRVELYLYTQSGASRSVLG